MIRKSIVSAIITVLLTFSCSVLCAQDTRLPSGATIKGTIDSAGYHVPSNLRIVWRKQGSPDIVATINTAAKFAGLGDPAYFARYANGVNLTAQGYYMRAVRAEFVGGRHWVILRDIFKLLGVNRVPSSEGYEVFDFALANFDTSPSCCDYEHILGQKDPFAGAMCSCGRTGSGSPVPAGAKTTAPYDLKLDGRTLTFKWDGEDVVNFTVYEPPAVEGAGFYLLGASKKTSIVLDRRPADGTTILLQARQRGKEPADVPLRVGGSVTVPNPPVVEPPVVEPPIVEPPVTPPVTPICDLKTVLAQNSVDSIWTTLTPELREGIMLKILDAWRTFLLQQGVQLP